MAGPVSPPLTVKESDGSVSVRPANTISFNAADFTVSGTGSEATISIDSTGAGAALTQSLIGFGSASNLLTGSANFTFVDESGSSGPTVQMTGDKPIFIMQDDTSATDFFSEFTQSGASLELRSKDSAGASVEIFRTRANSITFNDDGGTMDTIIKGDTQAELFYADGGLDNIGIRGQAPSTTEALHVFVSGTDDSVVIESSDTTQSSAPDLILFRNPSDGTAGNNDFIGRFDFKGINSGGTAVDYGVMATRIMDATNGYGRMVFWINDGTSIDLDKSQFIIETNVVVVNNANRQTVDFKVKGSAKQIIRTDADNNNLGVGTTPNSTSVLHVSDDGTKSTTVRIESTDTDAAVGPVVDIRRNPSDDTATDGDNLGVIQFTGIDDGGGDETYCRIRATAADTHSTLAEGAMEFLNIYNGSENNMMRIGAVSDGGSATNAVLVNPNGNGNIDFIVNSDEISGGFANFYSDASQNNIGMGTDSPDSGVERLHIKGTGTGTMVRMESNDSDADSAPVLELYRNSTTPASSDFVGAISFTAETLTSSIKVSAGSIKMQLQDISGDNINSDFIFNGRSSNASKQFLKLGHDSTVFNAGNADIDFQIETGSNTNMFKIDSGLSMVAVGQAPQSTGAEFQVANGAQFYRETSNTYTANHDVTLDQAHGHVLVMNASSSGANTFSLPDAPVIGMHVTFVNINGSNGMTIAVSASTTNQINGAGSGGSSSVSTTTKFQTITCHYVATDIWVATEPTIAA